MGGAGQNNGMQGGRIVGGNGHGRGFREGGGRRGGRTLRAKRQNGEGIDKNNKFLLKIGGEQE